MVINQIVWHRAEVDSQTDLCGGQTAHRIVPSGPTPPCGFYVQLILIMLINCVINISCLIHQLNLIQIFINHQLINS
jgi:hypothetical protein